MKSKTKQRIFLFDNLKFLLILLVVIGHFVDIGVSKSNIYKSIFISIYAFHMPLFLFIAGMFHKDENIKEKILSFISIGMILKILLCFITILIKEHSGFSLLGDSEAPWYMFATAAFIGITYLLRDYNKLYIIIFWFILGCFVGYDPNVGDYLYLSRITVLYPFYLLGNYINKEDIKKLTELRWIKICGILCIVAWIFICFNQLDNIYHIRYLLTAKNSFYAYNPKYLKYMYLVRLFCYGLAITLSISIISIIPKKEIKFITSFGSRTLQVYFWHLPILIILSSTPIYNYLIETPIGKLAWILIGIIITCILSIKVIGITTDKVMNFFKETKKIKTVKTTKETKTKTKKTTTKKEKETKPKKKETTTKKTKEPKSKTKNKK